MTLTVLHAVILLACILEYGATQQASSCKGRCGSEFLRGGSCQCDYTCLIYKECCKDYESQCTTKDSCKGRCGEGFKRGRLCSCDSECMKYNQCCPDFKANCGPEEVTPAPTDPPVEVTTPPAQPETTPSKTTPPKTPPPKKTPPKDDQTTTTKAPSKSTDTSSCKGRCGVGYQRGAVCQCDFTCLIYGECCKDYEAMCTSKDSCKGRCGETFQRGQPCSCDSDCMKYKQCCPDYQDSCAAEDPTESVTDQSAFSEGNNPDDVMPQDAPTPDPMVNASDDPFSDIIPDDDPSANVATDPEAFPDPDSDYKPSVEHPLVEISTDSALSLTKPTDDLTDESDDKNLCNGQPIGGVTTLSNGTVVVFRGHYFWVLDKNKVPGPAQGITQTWGIPSPIDTVFSRCNCLGKTYMFKGGKYWRFDNGNLDPGYPRAVKVGFDGLQGQITAALSVPQYRDRREAVYFFKRGGQVQKYTYQFGTKSSCNRKVQPSSYTILHKRRTRQAVSVLQPAINIQVEWKGFPSTITAAVSIPTHTEPEKYKYYVFSNSRSYNVRMDSGRPVVTPPKDNNPSPKSNDVFKCPAKKH